MGTAQTGRTHGCTDQCCSNVRKFLPRRRPHMTQSGHWPRAIELLSGENSLRARRKQMSELDAWDSFYVIIGSAAGVLIGLQFVVVTLVAERPSLRATEAGAAFATPTIVHFSLVLLISALIRVPWHTIMPLAVTWAVVGL